MEVEERAHTSLGVVGTKEKGRAESEEGKELVRRHFEGIWNRRNLEACHEITAEEFFENAAPQETPRNCLPSDVSQAAPAPEL